MPTKELQIVSFDNPYPPNYGGAIDVFYKIKALSELGVKIDLHCFYDDRTDISGLEPLCRSITLYKRKKSLLKHLSLTPYSVKTRTDKVLINNLSANKAPILFESLITTKPLKNISETHQTFVRCHNIEHDYSLGLAKSEKNTWRKLAFYVESFKLKNYESLLNKANYLLSLSYFETSYFKKNTKSKVLFTPVFQAYDKVNNLTGFGDYALYHGDLSISDNLKSVAFLIDVFAETNHKLVIASSTAPHYLLQKIKTISNVEIIDISNQTHLNDLIEKAQINVLYSFQRSGTKLKLFSSLYNGRHCLINKNIVDDKTLLACCEIAETKSEFIQKVNTLFQVEYELQDQRVEALEKYKALKNAEVLLNYIN